MLQDIAVAPLLVILPLLAGSGPQSGPELGLLVAKGTFGFGLVHPVHPLPQYTYYTQYTQYPSTPSTPSTPCIPSTLLVY